MVAILQATIDTLQGQLCVKDKQIEELNRSLLMKDGKIVSDVDIHAASLSEINEKMSLI